MKKENYEQRLRAYKQQKYNLLVTKQSLRASGSSDVRLLMIIDESLNLVDLAIGSTTRIIESLVAIESEMKSYQIIETNLEQLLVNNYDKEAKIMVANKLNNVGEHLNHLEQLLKYK